MKPIIKLFSKFCLKKLSLKEALKVKNRSFKIEKCTSNTLNAALNPSFNF